MITYISMLRGINVGEQKRIKTGELIALYESLGYENIKTYLQSGNVVFDSDSSNPGILSKTIEIRIERVFNISVAVFLMTSSYLQRVINLNPFPKDKEIEAAKLHVTFLSDTPSKSDLKKLKMPFSGSDRFVIVGREVYLYCPNGYAKTRFSNAYFEKRLGVKATTRNWKTVNALLEVAAR